ncbi:MAG: hypothetical protein FWE13_00850 [Firmicutes bacterium]|nr:hypothetical protein [Bacillota bacterium]
MELDYKKLADAIYYRKSTRSYSDKVCELLENKGDLVVAFGLEALLPDIKVSVRVLESHEVKNKKAKYCIGFYSEDKPLALENIGFIGQQLDLLLQSEGIATCWWGMKKPKKEFKCVDGLDCFITMMAGKAKVDEKRAWPDDFKRKDTWSIVLGDYRDLLQEETRIEDSRFLEVVRVAPSAVNRQPWLVKKVEGKYNFYLKNSKNPLDIIIGDMRNIDLGIAIAHFFVQAKAEGFNTEFGFGGTDSDKHKFVVGVSVWK